MQSLFRNAFDQFRKLFVLEVLHKLIVHEYQGSFAPFAQENRPGWFLVSWDSKSLSGISPGDPADCIWPSRQALFATCANNPQDLEKARHIWDGAKQPPIHFWVAHGSSSCSQRVVQSTAWSFFGNWRRCDNLLDSTLHNWSTTYSWNSRHSLWKMFKSCGLV